MASLNDTLGLKCYEGDDFVVRAKVEDGVVKVVIHRKNCGAEELPNGYLLGTNMLMFNTARVGTKGLIPAAMPKG